MAGNSRYRKLYEAANCDKFVLDPSSNKLFYINRKTQIETLNDLTEYAQCIPIYTIDTENPLNTPHAPSDPALIQIKHTNEQDPSIILLVEMFHLPQQDSSQFLKN